MSHENAKPLSEEEALLLSGYVMGDLSESEVDRLEILAKQNPNLLEELYALQTSFDLLPQAQEVVAAPARLREQILVHSALEHTPKQYSLIRPGFKWIVGIAAIAATLLTVDNLRLRYQLSQTREVNPERVAAILQQPNSRLIALTSDESGAAGTLLFTPGQWQEVIVSLGNLPPLPPGQIYRMWLALENGEVIYCGEFNTETDGSVFVRFTPPETPPEGVKATELFVTRNAVASELDASTERVLQGAI